MLLQPRSLRTAGHIVLLAFVTTFLHAQTPPSQIQEDWFDHRQVISRVFNNDQVAIYFDRDVNRNNTWMHQYLTDAWRYTKEVYDPFGVEGTDESRLYGVFHRGRHGGGHPGTYVDSRHGFRNIIDVGAGPWDCRCGTPLDLVTHEIAHIVESASFGVHGSPSFGLWGDSKWAEIYQYDVYDGLGMTVERDRWYRQMIASTDNFPAPNVNWFRDFLFPMYSNYGRTQLLRNYFKVLSENFPTVRRDYNGKRGRSYARRLNWGEFIHFWSGAANADVKQIATDAFGWNDNYEREFRQAQRDFPLPYHGGGGPTDPDPSRAVTLYEDCSFNGTSTSLGAGSYRISDLGGRGFRNNLLSSLRINEGYEVRLYENDNFGGASVTLTANDDCLVDEGFNDRTSSIVVVQLTNNEITEDGGNLTASTNDSPAAERIGNLTDNDVATKFLTFNRSVSVTYAATTGYVLSSYTLSSANDATDRDPGTWTLSGSNNGVDWTAIDSRSGVTFSNRFQKQSFTVNTGASFSYYKLDMTAVSSSSSILQVAEWELFGSPAGQRRASTPKLAKVDAQPLYDGSTCASHTGHSHSHGTHDVGTEPAESLPAQPSTRHGSDQRVPEPDQ